MKPASAIEHHFSKEIAHSCLRAAMLEYGGLCAAACMRTLSRLYGVPIEDSLFRTGTGVRFRGAPGAAHCAYVATAQFLSIVAYRRGMDARKIRALCENWQRWYEDFSKEIPPASTPAGGCAADESELAVDVLMLVKRFIEQQHLPAEINAQQGIAEFLNPEPAGEKELPKPKQYYDGIYADRESMFKHSSYALEVKLSAAVTKGDEAAALAALREISTQGEKAMLAKEPLRSAKNSMIGTIAFLARAAIQAGVDSNSAFALSDALTQRVEELGTRGAVLAFEESILLQFIDMVRKRLEGSYSPAVAKAIHYIENHMDEKLSLAATAVYAGVHPAYLSSRFKYETGQPFTAYVMARKVQESVYFIRHTGYSISKPSSDMMSAVIIVSAK